MKTFTPAVLIAALVLSSDALAQRRSDNSRRTNTPLQTPVRAPLPIITRTPAAAITQRRPETPTAQRQPRVIVTKGPSSRMSLPGRPGRTIPHYVYPTPRPDPEPCPRPTPCPPPPCNDDRGAHADGVNFNVRTGHHSGYRSGSGLQVNLTGGGDNFRYQVSLNNGGFSSGGFSRNYSHFNCSPPVIGDCPTPRIPVGWCSPYWAYFPSSYENYYGYSTAYVSATYPGYTDPALSSQYYPPAPVPAPAPQAPQLTAMEAATELMQSAQYADAARAFKEHLKDQPDDTDAQRSMGVALLLAGKTRDGIEAIGRAYNTNPALGATPLDTDELAVTPTQLRELSGQVITMSRRLASANGFITAAMLMQSRDRADLARKMLDDAKASGLDREVHARLSAGMSPAPAPAKQSPVKAPD